MNSSSSLKPLSYSNVLGDIDGVSEAPEVTLRRFSTTKTVYANGFFRRIRRESRTVGNHFGVNKRLLYDIVPLVSDEACGRTSVHVEGIRVDGNYTSSQLAGRLFITTLTGGVHKIVLNTEDGVLPAGGLHDTIMWVLPKKASALLDSGVWPLSCLPSPEQLSAAVAYCVRLRSALRARLSQVQYRRLLGRSFTAQSAFGEVMVLVMRMFMLLNVSQYHLVDCASLFVGSYCGVTEERRKLANYLARTARIRREGPGPHAWALGTLSQLMADTGVGIKLSDVLSEYNKYARHTVSIYARDVARGVFGVEFEDTVLLRMVGLAPIDHEHYSSFMKRLSSLLQSVAPDSKTVDRRAVLSALDAIEFCCEVHSQGVNAYNASWHKSGWQFGQFVDL